MSNRDRQMLFSSRHRTFLPMGRRLPGRTQAGPELDQRIGTGSAPRLRAHFSAAEYPPRRGDQSIIAVEAAVKFLYDPAWGMLRRDSSPWLRTPVLGRPTAFRRGQLQDHV